MKKQDTTNTFGEGLIMDLNPLVTPNNVVTNCLNGTVTTFNGNENVLQNDMGNSRIETAYLPEGYVPLGTAELGGIIYIVSYNPLVNKCQIGSFPSPERNVTTDELGESEKQLSIGDFFSGDDLIKTPYKKLILLDKILHPGDKFQIYCERLQNSDSTYISAQKKGNFKADLFPRYLKFNVVAVRDDGQINNLNDTLVWNSSNDYYILKDAIRMNNGKLDLDEYRNLISSNYNVFNSKVDGKLAILAELECIDTFDISWDAIKDDEGNWNLYFFLNWSYNNNLSKDKINLYNIKIDCTQAQSKILQIEEYPSSKGPTQTDILQNENTTFYTPYYIDKIEQPDYSTNNGNRSPRKNDGSDNQYLLYQPFTLPKDVSGTVDFTVYPGMPFGFLEYLKHSFSIDINKLGTGEIDLKEYRYWYTSGKVTINWALESYLERNKQIDHVKFNFYKFDHQINTWINKYQKTIDNDRVVKTKSTESWEESKNSVDAIGATPSFEYTVQKQGSYSGHFTDTITQLEDNQLYLVELEISYNNEEKILRYYRFLYTSNIFNDYYYNENINNDFKNIVLQEALDNYHPIKYTAANIKLTNQDKDETLLDNTDNKVNIIPETVEKNDSEINNYTIRSIYTCDVNFDLASDNDNDTFDIQLKNISMADEAGNIVTKPTNNGQSQVLTSSQSKSEIDGIQDILSSSELEGEFSEQAFSGNFQQTLETPFIVKYQRPFGISTPYSLVPLCVDNSWLIVDGDGRWIDIYLTDIYCRSKDASASSKNTFGDHTSVCESLPKYPNVYNAIKDKLKTNDVVAIKFRTHHDAKSGSQGNWTAWASGQWYGGQHATADKRIFYGTAEQQDDGAILPIYAMLDDDDNIQLFTFSKQYDVRVGTNWYGSTTATTNHSGNDWKDDPWVPIVLKTNTSNQILRKPMEKYYKIVRDETIEKPVKAWSKIQYYNNYSWNNHFVIKCNGEMTLKVNNEEIKADSYPNNIHYNDLISFDATGDISDKENFDKYVDMLIYSSSNKTIIKREDSFIELKQFDPKGIYDYNGNLIFYLKLDRGFTNSELQNLDNSRYKIGCTDEKLRVKLYNVPKSDYLMAMGREEEQNITVWGIIRL